MEQITKYFNAEKHESVIFMLVGLVAIILASYFILKVKQAFYNGISYPLIAVALIQIIVGCSIYFRSPKDIERLDKIIRTEKTKIQTEEIPRMELVMKNFKIYRWVEIALLVLGLILVLYFQPTTLLKGIGLGLSVQAGFMLILDYFAESRGKTYLDFLLSLK